MNCQQFRQDGTTCPNDAKIKLQKVGVVYAHYVCNVHLNQAMRAIMNFNSPTTLEVWCRQ